MGKTKTYKDFYKDIIGSSDIASLILVGCEPDGKLKTQILNFGQDDTYSAYLIDESDVEIGSHYHEAARFYHWMKIYDDDGLVENFNADEIVVYRAGEMGCIIQLNGTREILWTNPNFDNIEL